MTMMGHLLPAQNGNSEKKKVGIKQNINFVFLNDLTFLGIAQLTLSCHVRLGQAMSSLSMCRLRSQGLKGVNFFRNFSIKEGKRKKRVNDKIDKSTSDQAVDPATRLILFKMINNGIIEAVHGILSTGKEAVILYADGGPGLSISLKGYYKSATQVLSYLT